MSAGAGTGESKSNTSGSQNTDTNQAQTQTSTPNNLAALQTGWNVAGQTLAPETSMLPSLGAAGTTSIANAMPGATNVAQAGANAATQFASGQNTVNPANQFLTPFANGSQVNNTNPEYQNMVQQITNAETPAINGSFAAAGRDGSGAEANALAGAVSNQAGQLGYANFAQQQQNQLAAANQLSTNNATGAQQQLQGASLTPGMTSNLFVPGQAAQTGAYSPLAAYMQAITQGNGGGTQTDNSSTGSTTTGNQTTIGLNHDDTASFNFSSMFGGGGGGGG